MALNFEINAWSAWTPGISNLESWIGWAEGDQATFKEQGDAPKVAWLPTALKRRASDHTKAALAVAGSILDPNQLSQVVTVFASRHGESQNTLSILKSIAREELVSPMEFGLSVHNSTSGIFTIASGNHEITSAVAAGSQTVVAALLETACQLNRGCKQVLCVIADQSLPLEFRNDSADVEPFFSVAILCRLASDNGEVNFDYEFKQNISTHIVSKANNDVQKLISWLLVDETELVLPDLRCNWILRKNRLNNARSFYKEVSSSN